MRLRRSWIHWSDMEDHPGARVLIGTGLAHLNPVAAWIWVHLEEAPDRETLFRRLRRTYCGVNDRTLRTDFDTLLAQWLTDGWIEWVEDPVFAFPEVSWPV